MSQSLSLPPYFDGSNYAYWKVRMHAFLKSLDERVWMSVQNGWKPPSTTVSEFRKVSMCETAKEVWDILETTHEGTKTVKNSKLQMLTSRFEEIRMKDDKSFDEFYAKLNDIVNSSFDLGERIPEPKIVRKVLRSLPEKFRPKVTAIEESKDLDTIKIEELVGSLQTYELTISQPRKNKSITLNTVREGESKSSDMETLRDEEIAYFKNLKKVNRKALAVSLTDDDSNLREQSDSSSSEEENCYMAFVSTVKSESDKESEKVEEEVESNKSSDDSEDETDIHETYQLLFKESLKIKKVNKALFKKVDEFEREKEKITYDLQVSSKNLSELKCVNEILEDKVKTLICELERSNTQLQSFVNGTKKLDDLLGMNKPAGNRQGLGFVKSDSNISNVSTNPEFKDKNFNGLKTIRVLVLDTCGNKALFSTFDDCNGGVVTFGDGVTAPIRGKGSITIAGLVTISNRCTVYDTFGDVVLEGVRTSDNCYGVLPNSNYLCSSAEIDMSELWHQRLGHVNYRSLSKLVKKQIVDGLPRIDQSENAVCKPCQQGKQLRINHKRTSKILTNRPLELFHIVLMGPSRVESLGGKWYILVVVDDFSRFTWIDFLREKFETGDLVKSLYKRLKVEQNLPIFRVRSDHGKEFENFNLENFCLEEGIKHKFSSPITPQQNGVVERKNKVLQEMARAMLHDKDLAMQFWGEAINTACHIMNRVYLRPKSDKTPYEIWKGKKPTIKYFRVFGSKCYILRDRENLGKFDSKSDDGIFLGYSKNSRGYRVYNLHTQSALESVNVVIDDAFTEGESTEK
ncbi:uncharacterized protein LOC111385848 [Olea europaea var. sylvestris]|uniref:uncharacterized protein LOC111385848 n=1 Tax=Olea europaea var. sylvestris TaxID=158386 RepID=UPI000C1D6758|nr:uncharacterized protein LOC111385848 [Olea europaea var. sylvestris]